MTTERTQQGDQTVIPGAERSARQAAKARGEKIRPKKPQADPGPLFQEKPKERPDLFK